MEYTHVTHTFEPVYDKSSRILILGSFPSVKSRENHFYYGHPQNRFWKVTAAVFHCPVPATIDEKLAFLHENGIALWDTIASCNIVGSSDSSITNVVPNDMRRILAVSPIEAIYCNGATSHRLFLKYCAGALAAGADMPRTAASNTDTQCALRADADRPRAALAAAEIPPVVKLPSTSPANAAWGVDRLIRAWQVCAADAPNVTQAQRQAPSST